MQAESLLRPRFQEQLEPRHGFFQDGSLGGVTYADTSLAALAEGDTGRKPYARFHEQLLAEREGIGDPIDTRE